MRSKHLARRSAVIGAGLALALGAVGAATWAQTPSPDDVVPTASASPRGQATELLTYPFSEYPVQNKPVIRSDGSEGDLDEPEAQRLKAAALANSRVAALAAEASRFDLFLAQTDYGDRKWEECSEPGECARLVFYDWDSRRTVGAWIDRATEEVVLVDAHDGGGTTYALKVHGANLSVRDPAVAAFLGPRPVVANVSDVGSPNLCGRDLCVVVGLTRTDGDPFAAEDNAGVVVNLHREAVVDARTGGGRVLVDRGMGD